MADTNLLVLAREYKKLREEVKKVLSMPKGDKGDRGEKGEKGDTGDTGPQGFPGRDGKDGINGYDGKDGRDGIDGKDGKDGLDGVGVKNAYIDFDNSLVIVLTDGNEINAGYLSQETKDSVIANFKQGAQTLNELLPSQAGNANKFLKTDGTNVSWDTLDGSDINLSSPPVIGNTTPNAATFTTLTATGQTSLGGAAGSEALRALTTASAVQRVVVKGNVSGSSGVYIGAGSDVNTDVAMIVGSQGTSPIRLTTARLADTTQGAEQLRVSHTASAVNFVQVTGAATTGAPVLSAQGSDTNVTLFVASKGTGNIDFLTAGGTTRQYRVAHTAAAVNYLQAAGAATNTEPVFSAQGSDTNISMAFQSKGTGGISLSTGSQGTSLVNGTTVTAITRTASGSGYTSFPSISISAPTTAGGVQATASVTSMSAVGTAVVVNGGTGYTNGDVLTPVGGTGGTLTRITVNGVSGGVITSAFVSANDPYSVLPANPVSVTGGTGSGATFNLNYAVIGVTITNAGSGYVEQPTVTFSGGGGSGAAAYATVGSGTTVRSLGSTMSFVTPGGEQARISDLASVDSYVSLKGGSSASAGVYVTAGGTARSLYFSSGAGQQIRMFTGGEGTTEQVRVAHTASAVNYVQVTGAATGGRPTISAQGSDTNVGMAYTTKGNSPHAFNTNTNNLQFAISHITNPVNYIDVRGSIANSPPEFRALGADTNIDLALTPKGTGLVRFGTYTAGAPTATGYISIKAADGTTYKVLVGT